MKSTVSGWSKFPGRTREVVSPYSCVLRNEVDLGGIDLQLLVLENTGCIGFNGLDESFGKITHKVEPQPQTIDANSRFFKSVGEVPRFAIIVDIKAIMQAKKILLAVSGSNKANILEKHIWLCHSGNSSVNCAVPSQCDRGCGPGCSSRHQ